MPRPWDSYNGYVFDIDGTLLNCQDAIHYHAFCQTLSSFAGKPMTLDGVTTHGNTDIGILRDALALHGIDGTHWRQWRTSMRAMLCELVLQRQDEICPAVADGVVSVLDHLQRSGRALVVASGNLESIGWIKLERCGLRDYFQWGSFSDRYESRARIFHAAAAKLRRLLGAQAHICVVGDTPYDIHAARGNHLDIIAVASGPYSHEALDAHQPTICVRSLADLFGADSQLTR